MSHRLGLESVLCPLNFLQTLLLSSEFMLVFLPWMKYLETTEIVISNVKHPREKDEQAEKITGKMEHEINTGPAS